MSIDVISGLRNEASMIKNNLDYLLRITMHLMQQFYL